MEVPKIKFYSNPSIASQTDTRQQTERRTDMSKVDAVFVTLRTSLKIRSSLYFTAHFKCYL